MTAIPPRPGRPQVPGRGIPARVYQSAFARPFKSVALEHAFRAECARRFAGQRQAMIVLGAFAWVVFAYWDRDTLIRANSPDAAFWLLLGIRLGVFVFLIGMLFASTVGKWFESDERVASATCAIGSYIVFACAYWQMRLVPDADAEAYYGPGVMVVVSYTLAAFRLPVKAMTLLLVACLVSPTLWISIEVLLSAADLTGDRYYVFRFSNILCAAGLLSASLGHQLERSQRLTFLREYELALSNAAFRRQSQELQQRNEEIRLSSQQAEEKALALIDLKEKLRASADRKNQEKSQFLAGAVHDLRQPLQAIGNALEPARLCVAEGDAAAAAQMLELAQRASVLMAEQLGAMLEMSRLESGFMRAEIETVDLVAIAEAGIVQLAEGAAKEGVRLRIEKPAARVWVESDRHFLGRILRNLVGNGVKYCDPSKSPGCEVCIRVTNLPACVRLEIEDNGLGIAQEHLADGAIFKPFYQVGNRRPQADKGVGLGLSIVSALLALLPEHHLDIESVPGRGSRMILTMPHGSARFVAAAADAEAAAVASMVQLAGVYVVMVEDDELVATSMALLLEAHGAIHETVASFEAFEQLLPVLERTPDLVLSDFRLPNHRTAIDVCHAARRFDHQIQIMVLTGEVLSPTMLTALAPAAVFYKPLPAVELIRAIDAMVAQAPHAAAES
jgi:signal transduction histidine kinase/CheY-like chemotaxis protein